MYLIFNARLWLLGQLSKLGQWEEHQAMQWHRVIEQKLMYQTMTHNSKGGGVAVNPAGNVYVADSDCIPVLFSYRNFR
jgi:hypothetical protein